MITNLSKGVLESAADLCHREFTNEAKWRRTGQTERGEKREVVQSVRECATWRDSRRTALTVVGARATKHYVRGGANCAGENIGKALKRRCAGSSKECFDDHRLHLSVEARIINRTKFHSDEFRKSDVVTTLMIRLTLRWMAINCTDHCLLSIQSGVIESVSCLTRFLGDTLSIHQKLSSFGERIRWGG